MNIVFISTRMNYPPIGGHSQRTFNVIKHLSKKHKVFYIAFYGKGKNAETCSSDINEMRKYVEKIFLFNIPMEISYWDFAMNIFKSIFFAKPLIAYKYFSIEVKKCIENVLAETKIDFVHLDMLPLGEYKGLFNGIKCVLTEHNVEYLRYVRWFPLEKNFFKKSYIKMQAKKMVQYEIETIKKFNNCIVVSPKDKEILEKQINGVNFSVVDNGTDIDFFKSISKKINSNTIVWAGGMSMWPNRDAVSYFVQEIFPLILDEIPEVVFHVIGRNPPDCLEPFKQRGQVIVHGYVDDVRPVIDSAKVYVAPIRIGSGTKLKILDAMAMGKAVVTTAVGAEGIRVENNKHLFIEDNEKSFAKRVVQLLKDDTLNETTALAARQLVEKEYSWEVIGKKIDQVYEAIEKS